MVSTTNKSSQDKAKLLSEWKMLYTEALINALNPVGSVLEVGYGSGTAANRIQTYHPKAHTIIESNPRIFNEATKWANKNPHISVVQGNWETVLPKLGKFDVIFFNGNSLESDAAIMNFLFPEDALQASQELNKLLRSLENQMSQLTNKFSDADIDNFYHKIGQFNLKELLKFFQVLKNKGNISNTQYENTVKKYRLNEIRETPKNSPLEESKESAELFSFLEESLKNHMNKNGRFSCFLNSQISKYEDAKFFENIVTNPDVDYKETSVPIKMSDKIREGLIVLVEKSA